MDFARREAVRPRTRLRHTGPIRVAVASIVAVWTLAADGLCAGAPAPAGPPRMCRVAAFDGLRTLHARAVRAAPRPDAAGPSPGWTQFEHAATAILGFDAAATDPSSMVERVFASLAENDGASVPCDARSMARDRLAYRLALVGYSARDIAVMLAGQATRGELDAWYARGMAGLGRTTDVDTDPWRQRPATVPGVVSPKPTAAGASAADPSTTGPSLRASATPDVPAELVTWIHHYSGLYGVDPRLVAAVIQCESSWDPASQSPKGAIGLMQLMPGTAAMLGVDPRDAFDNVRGGIAYLAGLLRTYRDVRHALIAYNAGPSHANQVIRGERTLFRETQRYLDAVAGLYPLGSD